MKKIWLVLVSIVLTFNTSAASFTAGQQYIQLNKSMTKQPQVLEFFSFYCLHCYKFEHVYHISKTLKETIPVGIETTKYHLNFLGPLGNQLTQAWAVAMVLGIEDKVSPLLFEGIQKTKTIRTAEDIQAVFIKVGIQAEEYESTWNSFIVKSLVIQQEKAAQELQVHSVPAIFINGKYMVKNDRLDISSIDTYTKQFIDIIKFLLSQK